MTAYEHVKPQSSSRALVVRILDAKILGRLSVCALEEELGPLLVSNKASVVFLDFADVDRMTTEVIRMLLSLRNQLAATGGHLVLCGLSNDLSEVLGILRLKNTIFPVFDDVNSALESHGVEDSRVTKSGVSVKRRATWLRRRTRRVSRSRL